MSDVAIRVENLSKKFVLGERLGFRTFRETLQDALAAPIRLIKGDRGNGTTAERKVDTDTQIWALKDVSFQVKHGEVLGIIGPNGAGKSTLLKILSRITEPTTGYAEIRGRVGSLLEVGTGFHPELTGRENVYLNGSILGMSKAEIRRKFDDIVSFAGVEKFIDTPVKRYSSGMQVRLAFAVAAHLDPEILIVDEVLAVGDAEFQKRCLGKMDEVSRSGRTILFVSHNMAAVEGLCTRVFLIWSGRMVSDEPPSKAIQNYYRRLNRSTTNAPGRPTVGSQTGQSVLRSFMIRDDRGNPAREVPLGTDVVFEVSLQSEYPLQSAVIAILIKEPTGARILTLNTRYQYPHTLPATHSLYARCTLLKCPLTPGVYDVTLSAAWLGGSEEQFLPGRLVVLPRDIYGTGRLLPRRCGPFQPELKWEILNHSDMRSAF